MRKIVLAELMLSLVMPRDRAAAVVGDFAEASRGSISFVVAIVRTWLGAVLHQLSVGLFFRAAGMTILWLIGLRAVFAVLLLGGRRLFPGLVWMGPILGIASLLVLPIFAGYFVARNTPGREIPAWVSLIGLMMLWVVPIVLRPSLPLQLLAAGFPAPATLMAMFFGVLAARRRYLRPA
jgi:putative Ca2+/H+ antiporter (TMEM165/GDT1 family)